MDGAVRKATQNWNDEVNREMVRLIEQGTPPLDAADKAREIVSRRRREKAGLACDKWKD